MKPNYRAFFTLTRESFDSDLAPKGILQPAEVLGVAKRFEYVIRLGALALVTGDMGRRKSTTLRRAASRSHPLSRAVLTKLIRKQILEVTQDRKKRPVLIFDAVSCLRLQVLAEFRTITQFQGGSKPILPFILAG
ncbi:hypothetical protein DFAR_2330016 [Desulfarculales bacterium]